MTSVHSFSFSQKIYAPSTRKVFHYWCLEDLPCKRVSLLRMNAYSINYFMIGRTWAIAPPVPSPGDSRHFSPSQFLPISCPFLPKCFLRLGGPWSGKDIGEHWQLDSFRAPAAVSPTPIPFLYWVTPHWGWLGKQGRGSICCLESLCTPSLRKISTDENFWEFWSWSESELS